MVFGAKQPLVKGLKFAVLDIAEQVFEDGLRPLKFTFLVKVLTRAFPLSERSFKFVSFRLNYVQMNAVSQIVLERSVS